MKWTLLSFPPVPSVYHSTGPGPDTDTFIYLNDVEFRVKSTNKRGFHTDRLRYRVDCVTCNVIVHEATTGVAFNVRDHLRERHCDGRHLRCDGCYCICHVKVERID